MISQDDEEDEEEEKMKKQKACRLDRDMLALALTTHQPHPSDNIFGPDYFIQLYPFFSAEKKKHFPQEFCLVLLELASFLVFTLFGKPRVLNPERTPRGGGSVICRLLENLVRFFLFHFSCSNISKGAVQFSLFYFAQFFWGGFVGPDFNLAVWDPLR